MPDRIKALKLEAPGSAGGTQLDTYPTELNPREDAIDARGLYVQSATSADSLVLVDRAANNMRLADGSTTRLLPELVTSVLGGVNAHAALPDLVHYLDDGPGEGAASGAYSVDQYAGPLRTSTVWYTDNTMTKRLLAWTLTYSGAFVSTKRLQVYGADGTTVVRQCLDTYGYAGPLQTSRVRVWS